MVKKSLKGRERIGKEGSLIECSYL